MSKPDGIHARVQDLVWPRRPGMQLLQYFLNFFVKRWRIVDNLTQAGWSVNWIGLEPQQ